jgi:hypothetical protein
MMYPKMSKSLKSLLKEIIPSRLLGLHYQFLLRKRWISRRPTADDDHLTLYWNSRTKGREALVNIVLGLMQNDGAILEYGSHVGTNLSMLQEARPDNKWGWYAVEPNAYAAEFLKQKLPFVNVLTAEDDGFCRNSHFPEGDVTISIVNSVFYCMNAKRVEAVLRKLGSKSKYIIIGDGLDNVDGSESSFNNDPPHFLHPYRKMLAEVGFKIVQQVPSPEPKPQLNGYIVAEKA